jgi:tRNA-modifying protein YgfZ
MMDAKIPVGYSAAREGAVLLDRDDRYFLRLEGRAPSAMMKGMVTGALPPEFDAPEPGILSARAPYSLILTPKGRPLTDLRLLRLEPGEEGALLLDLSRAGEEATREHFTRYLPPRMARPIAPAEPIALLTLAGPRAAELLSKELFGLRVDAGVLEAMEEGEERVMDDGSEVGVRAVKNGDLDVPAFDLLAAEGVLRALRARLIEVGAVAGDPELGTLLRLERGRPRYGTEFDQEVLPPEVGLERRAIDHAKGCYTGQEVIVRIRDRGQVNRLLRGLLLGDAVLPSRGTPLFIEGRERPAGTVLTSARSPRFGEGIALALVRREAEPGTTVHIGEPGGPSAAVRALGDAGWISLDEG